jgi:hypothetical protein
MDFTQQLRFLPDSQLRTTVKTTGSLAHQLSPGLVLLCNQPPLANNHIIVL